MLALEAILPEIISKPRRGGGSLQERLHLLSPLLNVGATATLGGRHHNFPTTAPLAFAAILAKKDSILHPLVQWTSEP